MEEWLTLFLDLLFTAVAYLLVPIIFCIRRKKLVLSKIKKIVIINGLCVWLMFFVLKYHLYKVDDIRIIPVLLWSNVAFWLLKKYLLKVEVYKPMFSEPPTQNEKMSLSPENEEPKKYGNYNVSGSDLRLETEKEEHIPHVSDTTVHYQVTHTHKKQKSPKGVTIFLAIALITSMILNAALFGSVQESKNKIEKLNKQITRLENKTEYSIPEDYYDNAQKVDFYDKNIVFVIEGFGDYYFTYDEMQWVTRNVENYTYWAYNKEQAIYKGYTAYSD